MCQESALAAEAKVKRKTRSRQGKKIRLRPNQWASEFGEKEQAALKTETDGAAQMQKVKPEREGGAKNRWWRGSNREERKEKRKSRKKTNSRDLAKNGMRWAALWNKIVRGSLPRTQTKVRDFRRQDTPCGAELITTRVLTDTPSWRSSQWPCVLTCVYWYNQWNNAVLC